MMNKIRKLKEKKGFTLVELIVVIAIIAILTAVLVPLIGRWSTQASYTTLQDGAQTVSNSANAALNALTMTGKPCTVTSMVGSKSSGTLTVTVLPSGADVKVSDDGEFELVPMADDEEEKDETKGRIQTEMETTLSATLPDNSCFLVTVANGAVEGVVYLNSTSTLPSGEVGEVEGFDEAYEIPGENGAAAVPIGVSGTYKKEGATFTNPAA